MLSKLTLAAGAIGGAAVTAMAFASINALIWLPAARDEARATERAAAAAATEKAIGEISDDADQARFRRRLCRDRGWVYLHATGQCVQGQNPAGG